MADTLGLLHWLRKKKISKTTAPSQDYCGNQGSRDPMISPKWRAPLRNVTPWRSKGVFVAAETSASYCSHLERINSTSGAGQGCAWGIQKLKVRKAGWTSQSLLSKNRGIFVEWLWYPSHGFQDHHRIVFQASFLAPTCLPESKNGAQFEGFYYKAGWPNGC